MKKVLILLVSTVCVWNTYAQDVDSVQVQQPITIDSLAVQVEQLKHDLNYLQCEYELLKMEKYIQTLGNEVNIKTNGVLIDVYNMRYDRELYNAFVESYDTFSAYYDSLIEKFASTKKYVIYKVFTSDFNDTEIEVLDAYIESINHSFSTAEAALKYYDTAIRAFKNKR